MQESLFKLQFYLRRDSGKGFSSEFCKIFKKNFLKEHLWMRASILQQLLTLYFAIIYNWQLLSSEKLLVGKKFIPIFQGFCRFRFPLHRFVFHFLWQMPAYLVSYANGMLHSEQPTVLLARRHLNTMLLTNFENLNSISNIFQETHDFLVLTEPLIICIYLRTTDRQFCDQRNVRLPTSKLLKYDLV